MSSTGDNSDFDQIPEELFPNEFVVENSEGWELAIINKMKRDALEKIGFDPANMSRDETRPLVSSFYAIQAQRIAVAGRARGLSKNGTPTAMLDFAMNGFLNTEENIKKLLAVYSNEQGIGRWAESIPFIGPIISAGLIGHIDIEKAHTAGAIWRFGGYDPTMSWLGKAKATELVNEVITARSGNTEATDEQIVEIATKANLKAENLNRMALSLVEPKEGVVPTVTKANLIKVASRRPWNADLKVIYWKIGESFKINSKRLVTKAKGPDVYGKMYVDKKLAYIQKNENGGFRETAEKRASEVGRSTDAYAAYSQGMLPPGHLDAMARRYAVKMFLSHWHHVYYEMHHGTPPPKPFVNDHLGHKEYVKPPHWVDGQVVCNC